MADIPLTSAQPDRGAGAYQFTDMTLSLGHRVAPFRRTQFRNIERMSASYEEHAVIVEALLSHDVVLVHCAMRAHLLPARGATARMAL